MSIRPQSVLRPRLLLVAGAIAVGLFACSNDAVETALPASTTEADRTGTTLASSASVSSESSVTSESSTTIEEQVETTTEQVESTQTTPGTPANNASFSFAAAGDFTGGNNAIAVFDSIGSRSTDFTLALGDLGYVGNGNEEQWCSLVKAGVGDTYPFQLIAGNHDDRASGDGDILNYRQCLPNRVGEIDGDYAIRYSFDYENLARFILISPDIRTYGGSYARGTDNYNWVRSQAEQARADGLSWVFLAMHKNCITPGQKRCEIGEDLFNLAIEAEVDVILQGHEHGFFRSNQLAFGEGCRAVEVDKFNADCVADDDNNFQAGAGSVLVISGAGGIGLRDVNLDDEEIGYFASVSASNVEPSHGYAEFTVNESRISSEFIGVNGSFGDTFQIRR